MELTKYQHTQDSANRTQVLREVAKLLESKAGVEAVKVKVGIHQLAWIQNVPEGRELFCVRIVRYCPGVWRLTDTYSASIPKAFWKNGSPRRLRTVGGFEWSLLPSQFDPRTVADLLHAMAIEGQEWDADHFGKRWSIFPEGEQAHYAWTVEGKKRATEEFAKQDRVGRPRANALRQAVTSPAN